MVTTRIAWEPQPVILTADAALAALRPEHAGAKTAKVEATEFLLEVLAGGWKPAREVFELADQFGHSRKSLRSARTALGVKPSKTGPDRGWIWALPEKPSS
jgi:hypothetical protein